MYVMTIASGVSSQSRLISCYVDKFDRVGKRFAHKARKIMVRRYGGTRFTHFVQFVLDSGRKCIREGRCSGLDVHWRPYFARCGYCQVRYDVIGRMETFAEDARLYMRGYFKYI